ncbi:MAG: RNA methyltransferase [Chlorobiales bacterium]|nr:RNA methyltransferase [Chlorobiales bacterium]
MHGNHLHPLPNVTLLSKQKRKFFAKLRDKKYRDQEKLFLAEGGRTVKELLSALPDEDHLMALIMREPLEFVPDELQRHSSKILVAQPEDFKTLADTEHSQGVIGVFRQPTLHFPDLLKKLKVKKKSLIVVLDGLQDPGNAGTIIRTAAWFGVDALIGSADTVEYYNPKVVRSTAGSLYAVPLVKSPSLAETLAELKKADYTIYATSPEGADVRRVACADKATLIVGSEARGISEEVFGLSDKRIKISGRPEAVESLNAAVSAGILMAFFS